MSKISNGVIRFALSGVFSFLTLIRSKISRVTPCAQVTCWSLVSNLDLKSLISIEQQTFWYTRLQWQNYCIKNYRRNRRCYKHQNWQNDWDVYLQTCQHITLTSFIYPDWMFFCPSFIFLTLWGWPKVSYICETDPSSVNLIFIVSETDLWCL